MNPILDIRDFGAHSGDDFDCTEAFALAVARAKASGGATLLVPPGRYRSGPIELCDNTTLHLERGAAIQFISDPERYPPIETRWEGVRCFAMQPLVLARGARNVAITGEGTLDGNGHSWWNMHRANKAAGRSGPKTAIEQRLAALNKGRGEQPSGGGGRETQFLRPPLIQFLDCDGVLLKGVRLQDSPFWTVHPVFSRHIRIEGIHIHNPADAPNTDGIDIDSCEDVEIVDSVVDVGDDCVALKAGSGAQGLAEGRATRNVRIAGCSFLSGHGGVVIGSETAGGIENLDVSNCRFTGTDRGIRLKSRRGRGGLVQNLSFRNLVIENTLAPLTVNLYYECGAKESEAVSLFSQDAQKLSPLTPCMRNILVTNLVATGCRASAGFIVGLPESPIVNLNLEHCIIKMADENLVSPSKSEMYRGIGETSARGLRIRHAEVRIQGLKVEDAPGGEILKEPGALVSFD
ncbi:MAG: glycoside hydrolase family 28 protein [Spirochaetia bacterium]|nr:glycoside hydrolase family 28 protein [Spirochaetia bacterium]